MSDVGPAHDLEERRPVRPEPTADDVGAMDGVDGAITTIRRGLREAPELRDGLGVTWLLAAVGATGRIVVPIVIQQAIDHGITPSGVDMGEVGRLVVLGIIAIAVSAVAQRIAIVRLGVRAERALLGLRERLIRHVHRIGIADHNEERRGALVARVTSDIESLSDFFRWGGFTWLIEPTLMVIVVGVMFAYDWVLTVIAVVLSVPLFLGMRFMQKYLVEAYDRVRRRNGDMLAAVGEIVTGAKTIRAYGAGDRFARRTREAVGERASAQIRGNVLSAFLYPAGELFSVATIATIIAVGVTTGPARGLTAGALVGFVFLAFRFLEPVATFTEVIDQTQTAVAGFRRVLGVLDVPVDPPPAVDPIPLPAGQLDGRLDHVTFAYRTRAERRRPGDVPSTDAIVLRDVSVHIPAGQQVAVVGETGSGKTTLGRLIARLADPVIGRVELGGVPLTRVADDELRRRLVVVAQEPFLFDVSIADNIRFARPRSSRAEIEQIVGRLEVGDWVASLPDGLDTRVGERGDSLSAGERQLVALIRAGVADPDVLILDEATSSVDALTEVRISRALTHLTAGRTTIAIAHRLSTAARADRVLVFDDGRLVEDGHHDDLVTADGTYARLYDAWLSATTST